jgi:hypothetical protein
LEAAVNTSDELLKAVLATVARSAFPPAALAKIVAPTASSGRQLTAYNMCDGETPQTEICKKTKIQKGNLSRLITRWVEAGVMVRLGPDRLPLHIYPLSKSAMKGEEK